MDTRDPKTLEFIDNLPYDELCYKIEDYLSIDELELNSDETDYGSSLKIYIKSNNFQNAIATSEPFFGDIIHKIWVSSYTDIITERRTGELIWEGDIYLQYTHGDSNGVGEKYLFHFAYSSNRGWI